MNYAKLYIDVYNHPKFIAAGFEASGYWMHALAYLRHHESSNGFLAESVLTVPLTAKKFQCNRLCEKLVSAGLFRKVEGGYVLLRYAERNETREDILQAKAAVRERKTKSRQRRADPPPPPLDPPAEDTGELPRDTVALPSGSLPSSLSPAEGRMSREVSRVTSRVTPVCICSASVSDFVSASASESDWESARKSSAAGEQVEARGSRDSPARRPLPASERALSGSYWLAAFTEGITQHTGRPCTAGRIYVATLERIVAHHAPKRDAARASAWIREQAAAFAAKWDGQHPPKGLTPDGLERWLNDGRVGPPQFGKAKVLQLPASKWQPDDFSDYGARVIRCDDEDTPNGKEKP